MDAAQANIFSNLLSNDLSEIMSSPNSETWSIVNQLLSYKCKLIATDESKRQDFPLHNLVQQASSSGIPEEVLKSALVMQKTEKQFLLLISVIESCCCSITCQSLKEFCYLLRVAVDVSDLRREYLETFLKHVKTEYVENCIIESLYKSDKETKQRVIKQLLPKYLMLIPISEHFVCTLHNYAIETRDLLFLSIVSNQLYKNKDVINYLFLKSEQFWLLLEEGITKKDHYNLKLASFVLSKTIDYIYNNYKDINETDFHVSACYKITIEMKDVWPTYFLLLDMSQEKQLHLIEPCLVWMDQMKRLPPLWQNSIYKLYLKHHQNTAVYSVAENIFSQPLYNETIIPYVFEAINKNDCTVSLKNVYFTLKHFIAKLTEKEFEDVLKKWLVIAWNPVSAWHFCSQVFTVETKFKIPLSLLLSVLRKIEHLPDKHVRCNCITLVLKYFRHHHREPSFVEMLYVSQFLYNADNEEFTCYINFYEANFRKYEDNFLNIVNSWASLTACTNNETVITILSIVTKLNMESVIVHIKERIDSFDVAFKEDIYIHLLDFFSIPEVLKHIENRIHMGKDNLSKLASLLSKVAKKIGNTKIINLGLCAIENTDLISKIQCLSLANLSEDPGCCNEIFKLWVDKYQDNMGQLNGYLCVNFIELLIEGHLQEHHGKELSNPEYVINIMSDFLKTKDDLVIKSIFQMLDKIFNLRDVDRVIVLEFMHKCLDTLLLSKGPLFKELAQLFVISVYHSHLISDSEYQNEILKVTETLLSSLKENYYFLHLLAEELKRLSVECPDNIKHFKPICVDLFLHGMVTNKTGSPNFLKMEIRLLALECLLGILKCESKQSADQCARLLIEKYRRYYKKRYFPDSQINFHQLRIMQLLLIIQPLLDKSKTEVTDLIMKSFSEEIHQPCVKQLMEWLLILSFKARPQEALKMIMETMDMIDRAQPSSIVAFIPIIYHLALLSAEEHWGCIFDLLLLWSMGANFKLRAYSQKALTRLYETAIVRDYQNIIYKYNFLYMATIKVMECSLEQFNTTLKQDYEFFNSFDPCRDYCLEAILIDMPRMNAVSLSEWEHVANYTFTITSVPIINKYRTFSDQITRNYIKPMTPEETKPYEATTNVQKKITPWRSFLDQDQEERARESGQFILVASLVDKAANLGGLTRSCEVFGVRTLVLNRGEVTTSSEFKHLSMASENWTEFMEVKVAELKTFLEELKSGGYTVVGAEQTPHSLVLGEYRFPKKTALVLGNEKEGIPPEIISVLNQCIEIPQFGMTRSLNVHVAGALFMWEYAKQTSS